MKSFKVVGNFYKLEGIPRKRLENPYKAVGKFQESKGNSLEKFLIWESLEVQTKPQKDFRLRNG